MHNASWLLRNARMLAPLRDCEYMHAISVNAITGGRSFRYEIFGGCMVHWSNWYKHEWLDTSGVCWDLMYKSCNVIRLVNIEVSCVEEVEGGDTLPITLPQEHGRIL